ncbi:MAG: tRNA (adenosine(37)-N6)-threonylcarbamoyltransferase complex ATPase subunit type 1 TsaE [Hyphomicrobiales bacterium]
MTHDSPPDSRSRHLTFPGPEALEAYGATLALFARPGLAIFLKGDLGSGKSTLARAFIRAMSVPDSGFDIPSPTFTLVQTYEDTRIPVLHADLYRIAADSEVDELGLDDLRATHLLLVEWPERLLQRGWDDVLLIELSGHGSSRQALVTPQGAWVQALARNDAIAAFLSGTEWRTATRRFLEGDASFRRYETLQRPGQAAVLMDMPTRPDGPPVRDGKPYSAIAHLAEGITAVIAVNRELAARGYSAPATEAYDLDQGLAIIEDLGRKVYGAMIRAGQDMREPMETAVALLADMAGQGWPDRIALPRGVVHRLDRYDIAAQQIEVDLLPSWFWPFAFGREIAPDLRADFVAIWDRLLPLTQPERPVWTLRDFHSPNLIWLPGRKGLARVGLIDTQDCVLGHPAYDLASMLQDARVDIAFGEADRLFEHYCALRRQAGAFDREVFAAAYAILGAQRATKILGIFARLSKRDGKHGYLRHMPRVSRYLERDLQHPVLAELKAWFDRHLPAALRERDA